MNPLLEPIEKPGELLIVVLAEPSTSLGLQFDHAFPGRREEVQAYLPWAPLGVVMVAVLAVRLPRLGAPAWVTRRVRGALAALVVAVVAKIVLITQVNPRFRDPAGDVATLRGWAVVWALGNGVAILAVAAALALLLAWRARILDRAIEAGA